MNSGNNKPADLAEKKNKESIANYLWNARRLIIGCLIIALLLIGGRFVINSVRSLAAETGSFSSANLDRVSRGAYRLRAEVFGDLSDPRRDDTPVDFDRDLNLTISEENGLLSFNVVNEFDDIVIDAVHFRGYLRDRMPDYFHLVDSRKDQTHLRYQEASNRLPITIFATDDNHQRIPRSRRLLADLEEFREMFVLEFLEIAFYMLDDWYHDRNERIVVRYTTSSDQYRILEGEEYLGDFYEYSTDIDDDGEYDDEEEPE